MRNIKTCLRQFFLTQKREFSPKKTKRNKSWLVQKENPNNKVDAC